MNEIKLTNSFDTCCLSVKYYFLQIFYIGIILITQTTCVKQNLEFVFQSLYYELYINKCKSFITIHNCNKYYVFRTNISSSNIIDYINVLMFENIRSMSKTKQKSVFHLWTFFSPLTTLPLYHVQYFHTMCQKLLIKNKFKSSLQNRIQILFSNYSNFALNITLHVLWILSSNPWNAKHKKHKC
jgi:hypothetical protein